MSRGKGSVSSGPDPYTLNRALMTDTRPLYERPEIYQRRWFLLGVMCLSLVMVVMSVSGLNVALPSIQQDLDANATDLQWIVDAYAIVFAGLLLTAGAIGDRFGRKLALVGGLAVFALGSLIGVFADTASVVIISRAVSGVGAAFIMPATLSLLTAVFPPHERSKAIATWAGFAGAGAALGPVIVGFLLTGWWIFPAFSWPAAFVVNVVASVAVLVVIAIYAPANRDERPTPLDPVGAALSLVGLASLLFGVIEGPERGWGDPLVVGGFAVAAVMLTLFILWERRSSEPMLPLEFFGIRAFATGTGIITFAFLVMFGFFFLITQYFQFVRGYSPLRAGLATMPFALTMIIVAPRSARLVAKFGLNKVVACGFGLIASGFVLLSSVTPTTPYFVMMVGFVFMSAGMACSTAPATGAIMSAVPMSKAGVGSAVNDTTRELGGALGIAILGSIVAGSYRTHIDTSALPEDVAEIAGESIGGAVRVAAQLGGEEGATLQRLAGEAFTNAFNTAMIVSAVVAVLVGIVLVWSGRDITLPAPNTARGSANPADSNTAGRDEDHMSI
jgi:DHA2 family multidrug resistance protein-like MFS transporter